MFISYARDDEPAARRVAKALQASGLDIWWDADLPAHRAYSEVIERNLEQAKAVVVLWSKAAAGSQWVRAEADFARNAGKLVQAQIDGTLPPMPFNQIQCADLKGWRGTTAHSGWAKLQASVQALVSGEEQPLPAALSPRRWRRLREYRWWVAASLALLVAAGLLFYAFGMPGEERKPVLAVLPFRSLDAQDASLVAGIWEDTRQAIGRNPQLVVLGPNTAQALADKGEGAARKAADYLLEASVRTAGDRVRVSADLIRTKDGEQVWTQSFDRKLDDVFALQSEIASEIEGRIRGRLAENGGAKPEHIATSGEVYALYSDARAKIRTRDWGRNARSARDELQQVVKMDPNFAPGWAALAQVSQMILPSQDNWVMSHPAEQFARKAIDLAPNLAAGHAALALVFNLKGPIARAEIERAVQLDPNDFEAMLWLGNMRSAAGDKKSALEAYTRAAEIEPLFWPAVLNKYQVLKDLGDQAGIEQLIQHEQRLGGDQFVAAIRIDRAMSHRNLAEAANIGLQYWVSGKKEGRTVVGLTLIPVLLQLDFIDEAWKISGGDGPHFANLLWHNDPRGLDMLEGDHIPTRTFFSLMPLTENAGRVYLLNGRGAKLANNYLSLKLPVEEFSKLADTEHFLYSAPFIAIALRESGHQRDAAALLSLAEQKGREGLKSNTPLSSILLARTYGAEGRKEDALPLLSSAVNRGWLPEPPNLQLDLHNDPAFASLKGDPRFEKLRDRILGTSARERAQVNLSLLRQATSA